MKKIVIVSQTNIGMKSSTFGFDGSINPFKKSLSKQLKENLNEYFKNNNIEYITEVENYETLENIIKNSAYKILISPYLKGAIDLSNLDKNTYYILNEDEFLHSKIDNILTFL